MEERIKKNIEEIKDFSTNSSEELEAFRIKYLGKKGLLTSYFIDFKSLDNDKKKDVGQLLNQLKLSAQSKLDELKTKLLSGVSKSKLNDLSRPGDIIQLGSRHPISIVKNRIVEIFSEDRKSVV